MLCNSAGFLMLSGTRLYTLFWLLYICHLALKVFYPLKSYKLVNSNYNRAVYIAEVLIAIFIATAPSVVSIGLSNYGIVTFPPIQCGCTNRVYLFYTMVLPITLVVCIYGTLMLLTLYKIHVVSFMLYSSPLYYKKMTNILCSEIASCMYSYCKSFEVEKFQFL